MQNNAQCGEIAVGRVPMPEQPIGYKPMTLERHQELTALAYKVKDFIDQAGGLSETEGCAFGRYVQDILYLK